MATSNTYNLTKLQELAWLEQIPDVSLKPAFKNLSSADVPDFATPEDDEHAGYLLAQSKTSKPLLRTKKRRGSHTYKVVTELLPDVVERAETAGLAQALLRKAPNANAIENVEKRQSLVQQREALLTSAVKRDNLALVWLLASTCSQRGRDSALRTAVRQKNKKVIVKLLQYGADPNDCEPQFVETCRQGDHSIISMLLRGPR